MLILNLDEQRGMNITTPDGTVIRIVNATKGHRARLGIDAPRDVVVLRDGAKKREKQDDSGDR